MFKVFNKFISDDIVVDAAFSFCAFASNLKFRTPTFPKCRSILIKQSFVKVISVCDTDSDEFLVFPKTSVILV